MSASAESNRKLAIVIVLAAAAAVIVAFFFYALLQKSPPVHGPHPAAALTRAPAEAPTLFPGASHFASAATAPASPAAGLPAGVAPAWESTIDQILRSNVSEAQMAQMLINLLPTLPEDGQIEAANHIANLLPDSSYNSVRPLLLNASLPESVLSVFFTDLMNRDDPTKLNSFLDIAQIPNHPFHDEALSDLQIYVGDDYGTDWAKWKTALDQYLKTSTAGR